MEVMKTEDTCPGLDSRSACVEEDQQKVVVVILMEYDRKEAHENSQTIFEAERDVERIRKDAFVH